MPDTHIAGSRVFAVVPAAGHSRRMGQPKLLLEVAGRSVIRRLIGALHAGGVSAVYVLVRQEDVPLQAELAGTAAHVVLTGGTPDMRASIEVLLAAVARDESPTDDDGWLLAPADHPLLDSSAVATLLAARRPGVTEILVPVHAGRRGHPSYFSWEFAAQVPAIPAGEGVNRLARASADLAREVSVETPAILVDLDTPDDLESLRRQLGAASEPVCGERTGSLPCRSR